MVRRPGRELGRAGVDGLVDRPDAQRVPHPADHVARACRAACRSGRRRSRAASRGAAAPGSARRPRATSTATSLISSSWSTNHGSMAVASKISSGVAPARSASITLRSRPSCGVRICSSSAALSRSTHSLRQSNGAFLSSRRPQRLLQRLGEVAADRHRLADRLHVRGQRRVGGRELLEREPRHLDHDVVEGRLERRRGLAGDVVGDLVEGVADRDLGGDLGDREAGRLRRQRAGAGHPRVHLDDDQPAVARGRPRTGCCSRRCPRRPSG